MEKEEKIAAEIKTYMGILANDRFLSSLPEEILTELNQALGTAVSMIEHMNEGED
jgi:hypothetical protein